MTSEDKILFGQVANELKNEILDDALYAKAFSDAKGDVNIAKARYIKLRVNELRDIREKDLLRQREEAKEKLRQEVLEQQRKQQEEEQARMQEAAKRYAARDRKFSRCPKCSFVGIMKLSFLPPKGHVFGATAVMCSKCKHRFDWQYVENT